MTAKPPPRHQPPAIRAIDITAQRPRQSHRHRAILTVIGDDLAAETLKALIDRTGIDPAIVDDVARLDGIRTVANAARRDPDGRALRFALTQKVKVSSMLAGDQLFIDLLPESWTGEPPPLPREPRAP